MAKPKVIVIEGLDGVGKTIQADKLARALGVDYLKGGGWLANSDLGERSRREGNRDHYFSLMQMRMVRDLKKRWEESKQEGIMGVSDRFVLVDVAHILAGSWDENKRDFPEEAKENARESLKRFVPEEVWGIVLDVPDKTVIEERIKRRLGIPAGVESIFWLRQNDHQPEADTLERFEAKRAAWQWCGQELNWKIIDGMGTEEEVFGKIQGVLAHQGIWPEGQARFPEGRPE